MVDEHYAVFANPADGLIVANLSGYWTCDTVDRYKIDLLKAGAQMIAAGSRAGEIGILIDTRAFSAQSQDIVAYYVRAFSKPRFHSDRIAVVYESTLQKMQTRRMAIGSPRFSERRDEAVAWLRSLDRSGSDKP